MCMHSFWSLLMPRRAFAAALGALVVLGCASSVAQPAAPAPSTFARPADVETWPNVGATIRMGPVLGMSEAEAAAAGNGPPAPTQLRQVLMAPDAYREFQRTGAYPDGAVFAVLFYSMQYDDTHTPPLYGANRETGFVTEVLDQSHPDGRRFYVYPNGTTNGTQLPAGNACAVCHNARGTYQGTFAQFYPAISRRRAAVQP